MVARGGFYSYYNLQCIELDKENRIQEEKNQFSAYKTHLTQFLKMVSISFWVQLHAYQKLNIPASSVKKKN